MTRILVVDDQAFARAAAMLALRTHGFDAVGIDNGALALKAFQESSFDLAVIDVYMPGMDGVQLIKALRQLAPRLPIVAVSGTALPQSKHTALDYFENLPALATVTRLQKPYRPPELIAAIQAATALAA
jgi:CheY-like chemotaxis protein